MVTGTTINAPKRPFTEFEGDEIRALGREAVRANAVEGLQLHMNAFYKHATLDEVLFLERAFFSWEDKACEITRRCRIADILLANLGHRCPTCQEIIRFYETEEMGVQRTRDEEAETNA